MEFQVEEDLEAQRMEFVDDARAVAREELETELHPGEVTGQRADESQGFLLGLHIEGEDESARRSHAFFMQTAGLSCQRKSSGDPAYFLAAFFGVGVLGKDEISKLKGLAGG